MPDETLFIDDDDRYSRLRLIGWWDQAKLARAKVLVVGAGALGNEVLKNLALLGVGRLYVADFDTIENSNLTRAVLFRARDTGRAKAEAAAEALRDINPDTRVKALPANILTDVGLGLFRDVDVVIGCLDNREARLWVNKCCWKVNRPWVDGGIQEINGVVKVFYPPDGACYECGMTEKDYELINLRYSCPLLKEEDIQVGKIPTAPTISSMIGALQAQEAVKLLHGLPTLSGAALVFNGLSNQFYQTRFQRDEDCASHETYGDVVELPVSHGQPASALFAAAAPLFPGDRPLTLQLDRDLIVAFEDPRDGARRRVMKPRQLLTAADALLPGGETARPVLAMDVEEDSPLAAETLAALGVPAYDIVRLARGEEERWFLLAADRQRVME